jgi:hypothetical protein
MVLPFVPSTVMNRWRFGTGVLPSHAETPWLVAKVLLNVSGDELGSVAPAAVLSSSVIHSAS